MRINSVSTYSNTANSTSFGRIKNIKCGTDLAKKQYDEVLEVITNTPEMKKFTQHYDMNLALNDAPHEGKRLFTISFEDVRPRSKKKGERIKDLGYAYCLHEDTNLVEKVQQLMDSKAMSFEALKNAYKTQDPKYLKKGDVLYKGIVL